MEVPACSTKNQDSLHEILQGRLFITSYVLAG